MKLLSEIILWAPVIATSGVSYFLWEHRPANLSAYKFLVLVSATFFVTTTAAILYHFLYNLARGMF